MIVTTLTTLAAAGLAGYSYLQTKGGPPISDSQKIQKIFIGAGWKGKKGETIRIQKKRKIDGGTEYVYQLPLGFDRKKIEENIYILEDGLNVRSKIGFNLYDLKELKIDKTIVKQIKKLINGKRIRKEVEVEFDGMLKIRVYETPMPKEIHWDESLLSDGWRVPIGRTRREWIYHDFDESKHLLPASATGYGKSNILKLIVTTLLVQQPENVTFTLIDLKYGSSFDRFKNCKQVKHYETEPDRVEAILSDVREEMSYVLKNEIVGKGFEDVKEAKIKKRHFIIIDEAADLADNTKAMKLITEIARKGRGAGYYLVYSTQYPTNEAIPPQTKRNIVARLCYLVDTDTASRVVLDEGGAEKLPDQPGLGIYKNGPRKYILQSPKISNSKIEELIRPHIIKKEGKHEQITSRKTAKDRKYSIVFEENGLYD